MFGVAENSEKYLEDLVEFLHSIKWMFYSLNTHYVRENVISDNRQIIESLSSLNLNHLPDIESPKKLLPEYLQQLVAQVHKFRIVCDTIPTDSWKSTPIKKMSVKKQYEIENVSKVIHSTCQNEITQLVDFGSGLGYLGQFLFDKFGYRILGLESEIDRVEKAHERQEKFYPNSRGKVKYAQHFINLDSENFIQSQLDDDVHSFAIFGLHGCGDLTVTAIKLFLKMKKVTKLIFMPCCYHKMSSKDGDPDDFNLFPLSQELKTILKNYSPFLNRPFLRLAGQQSPSRWKEMSESEHWIHGKNMFERAMVEAVINENETIKRISNINIVENRVTMNDVTLKYQLMDKSSGKSKEWMETHHKRFAELREKHLDGEEMSENLFCLQTMIQNNCENLVLLDRIKFIEEEGKRLKLRLKTTAKKLQNDKLSPRCLILISEKL